LRTVDTETSVGRWAKLRADAALMMRLVRMLYSYTTDGRRVRSLYASARERGEVVWVDDLDESRRRLS
jgi:hypothetical protein